jgi:hypothetical protein
MARRFRLPGLRSDAVAHLALARGRLYWQCGGCQYQHSVTGGTVFEATKLPLTRWFLAMQLLTQAKNKVSALELTRQLGVKATRDFIAASMGLPLTVAFDGLGRFTVAASTGL